MENLQNLTWNLHKCLPNSFFFFSIFTKNILIMKNLLIIFATAFLFYGCDKDLFQGSDQLPAATQTGARTVGCLVNGKVLIPHKEGIGSPVNCFYQPDENGDYYFTMAFKDMRNNSKQTVNIFYAKIILKSNQEYLLNQGDNPIIGGGSEYYTTLSNSYSTNLNSTGILKITKIDLTKGIIAGTFWFDAVNDKGEKVEIREGRFDWGFN